GKRVENVKGPSEHIIVTSIGDSKVYGQGLITRGFNTPSGTPSGYGELQYFWVYTGGKSCVTAKS
ncbi:MAG TPA: hypothetical protein VEB86_06995, partial [Chryseosolibacter sp.]|nr:hypothetical protein [Chryseosolibacter sp.]